MKRGTYRFGAVLGGLLAFIFLFLVAMQKRGTAATAADYVQGVVTSSKGPEAGVWVIAESTDLPTKYVKIVVTDEQGRYVIPQLPSASYQVWVRGYGLVDSEHVTAKPGETLNLKAVLAPSAEEAAQYYPADSWYSMLKPLPGTPPEMINRMKMTCLQCHQVGDEATRTITAATETLGPFKNTLAAWDRRTTSGPSGLNMGPVFQSYGPYRQAFADWTDRIKAGEVPQAPPRPSGVERNIVVTEWDWGAPTDYMHDAVAGDTRDPRVGANGLVYGGNSTGDYLTWLNPKTNQVGTIQVPSTSPEHGMSRGFLASPYWGDEHIQYAHAGVRSTAMDAQARVWFAATIKDAAQAAFCTSSSNKFAANYPIPGPSRKQVGFYDPETKKVSEIDTCFSADHNELSPDSTTFFYGNTDVVNWVNMKTWDKTHDAEAAQGWVPAVLDIKGTGVITKPWTEPDQPIDPTKDARIHFQCYSISVAPDGAAWCSGIALTGPLSTQLTRISLGSDPPQTAHAEIYSPPPGLAGAGGPPLAGEGGVNVDNDGVVWQNWRGSSYITSFDRRKCKVLNGPTATGQHCPEGWTAYRDDQAPLISGTQQSATLYYLIDVDRFGVLGLGKNTPLTGAVNSDDLLALIPKTKQFVRLRVPYPLGFYTRYWTERIDDPKDGWKGRGLWAGTNSNTPWHFIGGKGQLNKVIKFQVRPDPMAK